MMFIRTIPKLAAFVAASALGLAACSDQDPATAARPSLNDVPVTLEVSSATAKAGAKIAVAVKIDAAPGTVGGVQGALEFDPSQLRYVGQAPQGSAISIVNAKEASSGSMRFTAFNPMGVSERVALFVFEAKGSQYMTALRYVHQQAATAKGNVRPMAARVMGTIVNGGLAVPSDVTMMTVADWEARIGTSGDRNPAVSAAPGEYFLNLKYGDVNFSGTVGLADYLAVANAAVGNDQIIIGTDVSPDVDLVIAGNVSPTNAGGACGTEPDGTRVLGLTDYLAIANFAVGNPETCAGNTIPGRGPLPTNVVAITGGTTGDITSGILPCPGGTVNWTKNNIYRLDNVVRVQNCVLNIEAGTTVQGNSALLPSSLYIYRGAQIFAVGTQNEPIVFTCSAAVKSAGCWGGLWISGRARINTGSTLVGTPPNTDPETGPSADGGCNQQKAEAGNAPGFGGCNDADNSGRLSYVRIEYGGYVVQPNRELNNLTLSAVGSGTIIDHVQAHGGLDDAIEFFGGRVGINYAVLTGNNDDGQDTDFGADGTHQFWIIVNDGGNFVASPSQDDSRAFESDNAGSSSQALPRTAPKNYNFTVSGFNVSVDQNAIAAIMLRRGSGLKMYNSLIEGYNRALTLRDNFTCSGFGSGDPVIENTTFLDIVSLGSASDDASGPATACAPGTGTGSAMEASFLTNSTGYRARNAAAGIPGINQVLFSARDNTLPDFRMRAVGASTTPQEAGTSTVPAGLVQTNYRGAVGVLSNGQIPWYAGWTRGWQSPSAP